MSYEKKAKTLIANSRKQNQYIYIPPDLTGMTRWPIKIKDIILKFIN